MKFIYPCSTVRTLVSSLILLSSAAGASAQLAGYYKLQVAFGHYNRLDRGVGVYDGVHVVTESSSIEFDDSAPDAGQDESYLVIFGDGQVTGHWTQQLDFAASYMSSFGVEENSVSLYPEVRLDVDVTGTVVSETANSVTLQLTALIDCDYDVGFSFGSFEGDLSGFGPPPASWSATDISLPLTVTATRNADGGLVFPVPTATAILPLLAEASPAPPSPDGTHIRDFALSGISIDRAYYQLGIGTWGGGPTLFNFKAPSNGLEPVFPEYYLLDVAAPYGFVASGFVGSTGPLTATFRYGAETLNLPMANGRALAPFDYGDAASVVEADIFSAGSLLETLVRPLRKVPLPPWAEPASTWSSEPGVTYSTSLDWPISLATTRTLAGASVLTGLWGITGAAESEMRVNASSQGTAAPGTLAGRVDFLAAGNAFEFTLGGTHAATLNASGLSLAGNCETSPFTVPLLEANITPLSLVPGLQSAVSAVHPFFQRLIRGTGLGLRGRLNLSASGGYEAGAADAAPAFTSGGIVGAVDVSARLHILPEMFRDFLYLGIEGGGGLESNIQLAPSVQMTSLGGRLYFSSTASLFGLNAEVNHDYTFGDPVAPAAASLLATDPGPSAARSSAMAAAAAVAPEDILPPGTNISVMMDDVLYSTDPAIVVASVPVTGQPAPASQITLRKLTRATNAADHWTGFELSNSHFANLAPTIGRARLTTSTGNRRKEVQAIVWSSSTTQAVATAADREAFANGMELRFQEFNSFENTLVGAQLGMTANSLCDFGAKIPQVSRTEPVRLFWARSHGTDFTGATTPLTLHSRTWRFRNAADGADDGWSPEVQTVGGLSHIIDWKPFTIGLTDSVIVITRDSDGNYETLDDSELWLVRETAGVWGAPLRLTDNAIADEQPVMFQAGAALRMAWRQGGQIVYLPDVLTDLTSQVLLPASVRVGPGFARAVFGAQSAVEGGDLVLAWPDAGGITYAIGDSSAPVPGGLMATPRHAPLGDDTITGFGATIRYDLGATHLGPVCLTTAATAGSATNIPATTDSRLSHEMVPIALSDSARSNFRVLTPLGSQNVDAGGEIRLHVAVEQRAGTTFQWLHNGEAIPGATAGIYHHPAATTADAGSYALEITDVSGTFEVGVAVITIAETFATWALDQGLVAPFDTRESDADLDGVPNDLEYLFGTNPNDGSSLPETLYLPARNDEFGITVDTFTFQVRAAATDCDYAIEHSRDMTTWTDLRHEQSLGIDGSLTQTIASSPRGTDLRYLVLIENASSDASLLGQPSFARLRMIRP